MKKSQKKIIILIFSVAIIAIGIVVPVHFRNSINIENYVRKDLIVNGFNGYGKISENDIIEEDKLIDDLGREYYEQLCRNSSDPIEDSISIDIDKTDKLSNGDKVTVTISVNYDRINSNDFNKKLHGKKTITKTCIVSGLINPVTIDPFKAIEQVNYYRGFRIKLDTSYSQETDGFTVKCKKGELVLSDPSGDYITNIYFEVDSWNYIDNGKVTIRIKSDSTYSSKIVEDKYYYASRGFILSETSMEFEPIEWRAVSSAEELDGKEFDDMKANMISTADSKSPSNWTDISPANFFYYEGYASTPCILAIFRFNKENSNGTKTTSYFRMTCYNIITDGKNLDFESTQEDSVFDTYSCYEIDNYDEILKSCEANSRYTEIEFDDM